MAEGQSLCSTQVREDGIHGVGLSGVVEPFFFYLQNWEQIQALIRMYESGKTYKPLYVRVFFALGAYLDHGIGSKQMQNFIKGQLFCPKSLALKSNFSPPVILTFQQFSC